ncbi:unnamed protein product [Amoebophrya sp. A25]|nr:unnamed protein product [Amoebophrya sp. A25]|eukprot:GSA25T00011424001.1
MEPAGGSHHQQSSEQVSPRGGRSKKSSFVLKHFQRSPRKRPPQLHILNSPRTPAANSPTGSADRLNAAQVLAGLCAHQTSYVPADGSGCGRATSLSPSAGSSKLSSLPLGQQSGGVRSAALASAVGRKSPRDFLMQPSPRRVGEEKGGSSSTWATTSGHSKTNAGTDSQFGTPSQFLFRSSPLAGSQRRRRSVRSKTKGATQTGGAGEHGGHDRHHQGGGGDQPKSDRTREARIDAWLRRDYGGLPVIFRGDDPGTGKDMVKKESKNRGGQTPRSRSSSVSGRGSDDEVRILKNLQSLVEHQQEWRKRQERKRSKSPKNATGGPAGTGSGSAANSRAGTAREGRGRDRDRRANIPVTVSSDKVQTSTSSSSNQQVLNGGSASLSKAGRNTPTSTGANKDPGARKLGASTSSPTMSSPRSLWSPNRGRQGNTASIFVQSPEPEPLTIVTTSSGTVLKQTSPLNGRARTPEGGPPNILDRGAAGATAYNSGTGASSSLPRSGGGPSPGAVPVAAASPMSNSTLSSSFFEESSVESEPFDPTSVRGTFCGFTTETRSSGHLDHLVRIFDGATTDEDENFLRRVARDDLLAEKGDILYLEKMRDCWFRVFQEEERQKKVGAGNGTMQQIAVDDGPLVTLLQEVDDNDLDDAGVAVAKKTKRPDREMIDVDTPTGGNIVGNSVASENPTPRGNIDKEGTRETSETPNSRADPDGRRNRVDDLGSSQLSQPDRQPKSPAGLTPLSAARNKQSKKNTADAEKKKQKPMMGVLQFESFRKLMYELAKGKELYDLPEPRLRSFWIELDYRGRNAVTFPEFVQWWLRNRDELVWLVAKTKNAPKRKNSILHHKAAASAIEEYGVDSKMTQKELNQGLQKYLEMTSSSRRTHAVASQEDLLKMQKAPR